MKLKEGNKAPFFRAKDQTGKERSLKDFSGQWFLLYFYPKDFTPGCTTEACSLRDNFSAIKKYAQVVGVSADTSESHGKFQVKYKLPFMLLADPDKKIIKAYGADGIIFAKRVSFLIDPKGVIRKIYSSVKPDKHAGEVLKDLKKITV